MSGLEEYVQRSLHEVPSLRAELAAIRAENERLRDELSAIAHENEVAVAALVAENELLKADRSWYLTEVTGMTLVGGKLQAVVHESSGEERSGFPLGRQHQRIGRPLP